MESVSPSMVYGELDVLVIPVEFINYYASTPVDYILDKVFDVDSYVFEVSYGQAYLSISYFTIWFTLSRTREYYGYDTLYEIDVNIDEFILDSLSIVDPYVDYNLYDYVIIVHAGDDQAYSGDPYDIWSRASLGKLYFSFDGGVYLGISIVAEFDPYGVYIHEFFHNLGLIDLYDSSGMEEFVGKWSLMGKGAWLYPPSSIMAVEKKWLGWITYNEIYVVDRDEYAYINLYALENYGPTLMVEIPITDVYYTVEYRRTIKTDSSLPGSGIIISYVNESRASGEGAVIVVDRNPATSSKDDAYFTSGDLYINYEEDFYVEIISLTPEYASIFVQNGIPNIAVRNIFYSNIGNRYNFSIEIINLGGPNPSPFNIYLYIDDVLVRGHTYLNTLDRDEVDVIQFMDIVLSYGTHKIKVVVDREDNIIEWSEEDNSMEISIEVSAGYILKDYTVYPGERVDVGTDVLLHLYFVYEDGVTPYADNPVVLNNTLYFTDSNGWVTINVKRDSVGKVIYLVTDPIGSQDVIPEVIFDMVSITLYVVDDRIDVGSTAEIYFEGYYLYDGTIFTGEVYINDSLTKYSVGIYGYTVEYIVDNIYGLERFISNSVSVIFDRVNIVLQVDKSWINIGENASIKVVDAYYEYDGSIYTGKIYLNLPTIQHTPGEYTYTIAAIDDPLYGLTVFRSNTVTIVFDAVEVMLHVKDNRVDVGSSAEISILARYAYSKAPYQGIIGLNDSLYKDEVGIYWYRPVILAPDPNGITVLIYDPVYVIFDKVVVTLYVDDPRIDVGSDGDISYIAYYAYDGTMFRGRIYLNDTLSKDQVGIYYYTVERVEDELYGLTAYESNVVSIIFDKVIIELIPNTPIAIPGMNASIDIRAYYEYDGKPFNGRIYLNGSTYSESEGTLHYTVESIVDELYGLSIFESNVATIIFEEPILIIEVDLTSPFEAVIRGAIYLRGNDTLLEGVFKIDGESISINEDGYYVKAISVSMPINSLDIEASILGRPIEEMEVKYSEALGLNINSGFKGEVGEISFIHTLTLSIYLIAVVLAVSIIFIWKKGLLK